MAEQKFKDKKSLKQGQTFTPRHTTNDMLNLLDDDVFAKNDTFFFEPCCGNGEMLIVIIERIYNKLLEKYEGNKEKALADCLFKYYAIELDDDLVVEARMKIFEFFCSKIDKKIDLYTFCHILLSRCVVERIECKDFFDFMGKRPVQDDEIPGKKKAKKNQYL